MKGQEEGQVEVAFVQWCSERRNEAREAAGKEGRRLVLLLHMIIAPPF